MSKQKNIYFCGSIRGGQNDVEIYKELISFMKQFGNVSTYFFQRD
jgi:hypothetical protein